jgi:hypothetical protein
MDPVQNEINERARLAGAFLFSANRASTATESAELKARAKPHVDRIRELLGGRGR